MAALKGYLIIFAFNLWLSLSTHCLLYFYSLHILCVHYKVLFLDHNQKVIVTECWIFLFDTMTCLGIFKIFISYACAKIVFTFDCITKSQHLHPEEECCFQIFFILWPTGTLLTKLFCISTNTLA